MKKGKRFIIFFLCVIGLTGFFQARCNVQDELNKNKRERRKELVNGVIAIVEQYDEIKEESRAWRTVAENFTPKKIAQAATISISIISTIFMVTYTICDLLRNPIKIGILLDYFSKNSKEKKS